MAEFVRLKDQSWINTDVIVGFDKETVLLVDKDGECLVVMLEDTCSDFQKWINKKRGLRLNG